jgi:hypothetical protein
MAYLGRKQMTPRIRMFAAKAISLAAVSTFPFSSFQLPAQEFAPPAPAPVDAAPGDFAPAPMTEGVEVLTRGIVHEAFAEVVTDPKPGLIVGKKPPEAIDEVPPEFKPEEEGAIWITGYWAWDDERDDFFWQSGVWRVPPPGQRWVAGYWNEVPGGWQWISGFWVAVDTDEIRYYAPPPASLEAGPTSDSPGDDYFWATGSWVYQDTNYRWQPGYWAPYQEDWVWISARYVWTPAGCVYLPGRWDHRLTRRGCMFAPVYFTQPVYRRPNYVYRPWCALNTPNLFVHLWVRPNYGHFYFGNYYGSNWGNWGVTPWCQYRPYRNCYDPMLTQLQCHYRRSGVNYISRLDGWNRHYASNVGSRPARTWNEQVKIVNKTNVTNINNVTNIKQNILAVNLQDASKRKDLNVKFARLDDNMQKQAINLAKETRHVREQRVSVERPAGLTVDLTKKNEGKSPDKTGDRKVADGQRGPRPGNREQVRLKLPTTEVADAIRQNEKHAPPKLDRSDLSKIKVELPGGRNKNRDDGRGTFTGPRPKEGTTLPKVERPVDLGKNRDDGRGSFEGSKGNRPKGNKGSVPQPKVELPSDPPKVNVPRPKIEITPRPTVETPKPQPKLEIPQRQPKVETPQPQPRRENPVRQPRLETPRPQPKVEVPQPQPRAETPRVRVETPQPKVEVPRTRPETPRVRVETPPRERPQIKLDIPKTSPRMQSAPRPQVTPRVANPQPQVPRAEGPRNEPRRGGVDHPRGPRGKKE